MLGSYEYCRNDCVVRLVSRLTETESGWLVFAVLTYCWDAFPVKSFVRLVSAFNVVRRVAVDTEKSLVELWLVFA
jgi:hypothetical protein